MKQWRCWILSLPAVVWFAGCSTAYEAKPLSFNRLQIIENDTRDIHSVTFMLW